MNEAQQVPCAHLPGAVAALAAEVLPVGQQAAGPGALQGQAGVYEGGGPAVVVHEERLQGRAWSSVQDTSTKVTPRYI